MVVDSLRIPNQLKVNNKAEVKNKPTAKEIQNSEFSKLLEQKVQKTKEEKIKFSSHATKRIEQRKMGIDSEEMANLEKAFSGLASKGGRDSLVLTSKGAYVVDVPNKLVVTAMHKHNMDKNVFTNIDSTIFIDG